MFKQTQFPYLIKLLDDESPVVREAVIKELTALGQSLEEELAQLSEPPNANQKRVLQKILSVHHRKWLKEVWPSWFNLKGDKVKLEAALSLLAEFQYGKTYPLKLKDLLDQLSNEYETSYAEKDVFKLSHFLFKAKELKGTHQNYYNPYNSNLVYVIQEKQGIPISLVSIYILIGERLGLDIEGCNFPGHFLARVRSKDQTFLVDCFDGGRFLDQNDHLSAHTVSTQIIHDITQTPPDAMAIIARVLRNLVQAYQSSKDQENSDFMLELLKDLDHLRRDQA